MYTHILKQALCMYVIHLSVIVRMLLACCRRNSQFWHQAQRTKGGSDFICLRHKANNSSHIIHHT